MTDILVEENSVHIDEADMTAILDGLREAGYSGEPAEQSTILKAAWWVIVLHWVGGDLPHLAFDSTLTLLAQRVWKHYKDQGKTPPTRIDLVDVNDNPIASQEISDVDSLD
jgi:hypothetical protein